MTDTAQIVEQPAQQSAEVAWDRWYGPAATQVAFPLGGIGTGNISLGARGDLRDVEIWHETRKGFVLPFTHFILHAQPNGGESVTRVLEGPIAPPYPASHGIHPNLGGGLPRFAHSRFRGRYPVAELDLRDSAVPLHADLVAYTPFVPLDADASGLPCAIFHWRLTNPTNTPVQATIVGSMLNPGGYGGVDVYGNLTSNPLGGGQNLWRNDGTLRGVFFAGPDVEATHLAYMNAALTTTAARTTAKPIWRRGGWYDTLRDFWDDLSSDGLLTELPDGGAAQPGFVGPEFAGVDPGSTGALTTLAPGESTTLTFILSWYVPNRVNGWDRPAPTQPPTTRVRYAGRFQNAWEVALYVAAHLPALEVPTLAFRDALNDSTLPRSVIDAAAANIVVARSTTCFWLEDGRFFGWEGCFDRGGCCSGNCTHVWNYAQTLAFLFPTLENSMLRTSFLDEVEETGKMRFRVGKTFDLVSNIPHAAADGQLGMIIRLWRAFMVSGDLALLRDLWPNVQKTLRYALTTWDTDGDAVLDGQQHNTYDIEFFGSNPLSGVMLLGALRAAEEMAIRLNDPEAAARYRDLRDRSSARLDELLWTGDYYRQLLPDVDAHPYQHGEGCLSDQLLGQQLAHVAGLGHLLPPAKVRSALEAIYRYNFRHPLGAHVNAQRTYAFADEAGLLLCSWPHGGRPRLPFVYSDEVWTGIEYQVAAHLIAEGLVEQGLSIVSAVRQRHDGYRRNPWDEVECGHHYARAMASWAVLLALSGFQCDVERRILRFTPALESPSTLVFSCGAGWGIISDARTAQPHLHIRGGNLDGFTIYIGDRQWTVAHDQLA